MHIIILIFQLYIMYSKLLYTCTVMYAYTTHIQQQFLQDVRDERRSAQHVRAVPHSGQRQRPANVTSPREPRPPCDECPGRSYYVPGR